MSGLYRQASTNHVRPVTHDPQTHPAGTVRVYQKDSKGGLLFIGEDHIDHTPKDEFVTVKIGNAFDLVAERKQTDFKKIADKVYEMEFAITLRNHKALPLPWVLASVMAWRSEPADAPPRSGRSSAASRP